MWPAPGCERAGLPEFSPAQGTIGERREDPIDPYTNSNFARLERLPP
jgi:hypothetical protein